MLWEEDEHKEYVVPEDVVDVRYRIHCKMLPTTHAWELKQQVCEALPWFEAEAATAIHQIHGAASGNGWERPPDGELIHLSRRSQMILRVPQHRVEDALMLVGTDLDIAGYPLGVGAANVKALVPISTVFARYVVVPDALDENGFMSWVVERLQERGIRIRKMLCGKSHQVTSPEGDLETRSVMLADLQKPESIALQEQGVGPGRHLGCGVFIPHKGIRAVDDAEDKSHFTGT